MGHTLTSYTQVPNLIWIWETIFKLFPTNLKSKIQYKYVINGSLRSSYNRAHIDDRQHPHAKLEFHATNNFWQIFQKISVKDAGPVGDQSQLSDIKLLQP